MTLEDIFGKITPALIFTAIPLMLQLWKMGTGWQDKAMFWTSIIMTYVVVDLFYIGSTFRDNPYPETWEGFFIILGCLLYPVLVWFYVQGIYSVFIKNSGGNLRLKARGQ